MTVEKAKVETSQAAPGGSTPDDQKVIQDVDAKLQELNYGKTEPEKKPEKEAEVKATESDKVPPKEPDKVTVKEPEKASDAKTPTLPVGYRRAALARGFTDKEIDEYLATSPSQEDVLGTFKPVFDEWQRDNSLWSERGRQLMAASKPEPKPGEGSDADDENVEPEPIDAEALVEQYGNEDLVKALVPQLNAAILENRKLKERLDRVEGSVTQSQDAAQTTREETLFNLTQAFFTSDTMKPYNELYGTDVKTLTEAQVENRMKLLEGADYLIRGALDHGRELTVVEALDRAHSHVSRDSVEAVVRAQIRDKVKARTQVLNSTKAATSSALGGGESTMTEAELVRMVDQKLQEFHRS